MRDSATVYSPDEQLNPADGELIFDTELGARTGKLLKN